MSFPSVAGTGRAGFVLAIQMLDAGKSYVADWTPLVNFVVT